MSDKKKQLFLIDGTALIYRSYYAMMRNPLITSDGRPTGAVFGFVSTVLSLLERENPDYFAIVFDVGKPTFRHERYELYKANRKPPPDDLIPQFPIIEDVTKAMNIPVFSQVGVEADDILATFAEMLKGSDVYTFIVSSDKDLMQLVNENLSMCNLRKMGMASEIIDSRAVEEKMGVPPDRVLDLLALMGDSSDNIPGVRGIGPKTAAKLLQEYGSFEGVFEHVEEVKGKNRERLIEDKEKAELSRELATLKTDVELSAELKDLIRKPMDAQTVEAIFRDLEFFSLIPKIQQFVEQIKENEKPNLPKKDYEKIITLPDLENLFERLKKSKIVSYDLETTSLDPLTTEIVGIAVSAKQNSGFYIPLKFPEKDGELFAENDQKFVLKLLEDLFGQRDIIFTGQNLKFDCAVLKNHGVNNFRADFDTMIAAYLLDPGARSYKLANIALRYLHIEMQPIEDLIGKGKNEISFDQVSLSDAVNYACEDADVALQLTMMFQKSLEENGLLPLFEKVEIPLLSVLLEMEQIGLFLDTKFLESISNKMGKSLAELIQKIYDLAGEEFNINSTKQLREILFEKLDLPKLKRTKTGYSTDVTVLTQLQHIHDLPKKLLEYREIQKLKSTYVDAFPKLVHSKTERVHSSFNQTITATGRLSSINPNFQNIPIRTKMGREIRKAFVPQKNGWKILSADYSQVELRIMAELSQDEHLIASFQNGEDIHAATAALVNNCKSDEVTPEMRRTAKVANFGIMYGAGAFRMSSELGMTMKEAQIFIDEYFEKYVGIKQYVERTIAEARDKKYASTLLGRKRYLPQINDRNFNVRQSAERMAI
ncbi:MAG: DNA polymerase I, partial [Candidatus Marinimicrobia bacterium]|nr:DNA polymerase I [Candidatus Neomarinimicrobiota bacterium]